MTIGKIIFCIVVIAWLFDMFIGILHCKEDIVNWWLIIGFGFVPFLAIIAYFCGL